MEHLSNKNHGQTIVEAVVALSIIVLVLTAITVAIISSVNNSLFIRDQSIATKYAQQGMEAIKYIRNNNPSNFFLYSGTRCLSADNIPAATACNGINLGGIYKREATFVQNDVQCGQGGTYGTKVTVTVSWRSAKCPVSSLCHTSNLVSCFSTIPDSLKTL